MKGLFITFEGNDGSGKSSVITKAKQILEEAGYAVTLTREPGGSTIAEKIRTLILDPKNLGMDDRTEALLYAASRREHLIKTVLPALEKGNIVLCDRFLDSSLVYQGLARNIGMEEIYNLNMFAVEGKLPDLTLFVQVRPEVGLSRISLDNRELDRLELEGLSFQEKVYRGYQYLAQQFPQRIKVINGECSKEEVCNQAVEIIMNFVKEQ